MKSAAIFWFTGLSGAGKTTVADAVTQKLTENGISVLMLDGDEVRKHFHCDLGFSRGDVIKNNALIVKMCEENRERFDVIFVPIISPFVESRDNAKACLADGFYEVYFKASLDYVVRQDVKGLYAKARDNMITDLIGFSEDGEPYEPPKDPDFIVHSEQDEVETSIQLFYDFVASKSNVRLNGEKT